MKLKIKKANKFYLVENDSATVDSSVEQNNNVDIFAIKDTDSKYLKDFKEYCVKAANEHTQDSSVADTSINNASLNNQTSDSSVNSEVVIAQQEKIDNVINSSLSQLGDAIENQQS